MSSDRPPNRDYRLVPVSCSRDCGAGCPLAVELESGIPKRIINNPKKPQELTGCPRGYRALESARSFDRLMFPLKRTGKRGSGNFDRISWDQALDEIAERLEELKEKWGSEALFVPPGSATGRGVLHNTQRLGLRLFRAWGKVSSTLGWYSNTASDFAVNEVFGTKEAGFDPSLLEKSRLIVLWGFNQKETRFGSALDYYLKRAADRGTPVWVIDPRKTRTVAAYNARWIPIYPGSDGVLMAAFLYEVLRKGLENRSFLDKYSNGFESLERFLMGEIDGRPKSPEWAAPFCGLPAETIEDLASEFASASPAALLPGLSIQRVLGGEEAFRMAAALQAALGNTGLPGGSSGCCIWGSLPIPAIEKISADTGPVPYRIPVNLWAKAALGTLDEEERCWEFPAGIKGFYSVGSNYLLQSSDLSLTRRALEQMDLVVVHDLFLTQTARMADYVLPTTHYLERDDVLTCQDNYLFYSYKVLDPPGEARNDYEILSNLAERLNLREVFTEGKSSLEWLDSILTNSEIDDIEDFHQTGIYDGGDHGRMAISDFINDPETNPLATPSGKIDFQSSAYEKWDLPPYPAPRALSPPPQYPLRLVSPHGFYRVNSQNSNLSWERKLEAPGVRIHPKDGRLRGLADGCKVTVQSENGRLNTVAVFTEDVKPGVVWILQGGWLEGEQVNMLSSTKSTYPSAGSRTHTIWVEITGVGGPQPSADMV